MARGKATKKEGLSMEERLEQALVADWEQPYKVPSNWVWIRLLEALDNLTSSSKKIPQKEYLENGQFAIVDQGKTIVGGYSNNIEYVYDGNLPAIVFGDHTRCIKYIDFPFIQGADGVKILKAKRIWDDKCFYYGLQNINIKDLGYRRHFPLFSQLSIPLPPLAEQQRIVDRIESLFAKLDDAKEKTQAALDSFETRKAAILHKAFTGMLTQKWREENEVGLDSWEEKALSSLCESIFDGDHMPPPKSETGVPFLVISNVNKGVLSFENTRFVSQEYYDKLSNTRKPKLNDVLYTIVGSFGIPVLVDDSREFCFQRHMALLKPQSIDSKLLWYLLQTQEAYQKANEIATGTAQLTVPIKGLRELSFLIPTPPEQIEIVRILDSLFVKEQKAKELADVIEKIDLMKKAILARAFRGELGTNDPDEESAIGLLKNIILEKISNSIKGTDSARVVESVQIEKVEGKEVAKSILEALQENKELTPEQLKALTELEIDDFYDKLKELVEGGQVVERREGGESFLEVAHES